MFTAASHTRPVRLAGSTDDVQLTRLHRATDDATLNEVVFPAGWTRVGAGSFDVHEEVLWLDGDFAMSGDDVEAGTHCWYPAGFIRSMSSTTHGARALAWFSGAPKWTDLAQKSSAPGPQPIVRTIADVPEGPGPVAGTTGRLLRDGGDGRRTWLLDGLDGQPSPPDGALVAVLDGRAAAAFDAGMPLPRVDATALVIEGTLT